MRLAGLHTLRGFFPYLEPSSTLTPLLPLLVRRKHLMLALPREGTAQTPKQPFQPLLRTRNPFPSEKNKTSSSAGLLEPAWRGRAALYPPMS